MAKRIRLLIIDDEPDILEVMDVSFGASGNFEVAVADGAASGLEKALSFKPDVILLDLVMPEKSGADFYAELRAHPELSGVPVLLMTGRPSSKETPHPSGPGLLGVQMKPVEPREVAETLARAVA
jgi:DNA-binding response OmpR family regulator